MSTRPLATACIAAAIATSAGCLSSSPSLSDPPPLKPSKNGKPTTADPISDMFQHELASNAQNSANAPPTELLRPAPDQRASAPEKPLDNSQATIEALRRKSESYARALEVLMSQRAVETPAPKASAVQWIEPESYQLSLGPAETNDEPKPKKADSIEKKSAPKPQDTVASKPPAEEPVERPLAKSSEQPETDSSNLPLALGDVTEKQAVAILTTADRKQTFDAPPLSLQTSPSDSTMLGKLAKRTQENPRDIASHLDYQMMLYLRDEQVPNLAAIATLPQEDRELVTAVLDGLSNLRSTLRRDANLMIAEKIKPIVELSERLKTTAELTVPTMVLCNRVEGFGRYELLDSRLIAGRETAAIVYCEIENFSSQFNAQQEWETNLSMEVVLFSEMGQQVFQDLPAKIADTSRSRRRDFFVRKVIKFPPNLTIGRYVLKVTMVDTQSNRVAETSLPVQIVAQ